MAQVCYLLVMVEGWWLKERDQVCYLLVVVEVWWLRGGVRRTVGWSSLGGGVRWVVFVG